MVGLRVYIAPSSWARSPYVVAAAGADYARATVAGASEESYAISMDSSITSAAACISNIGGAAIVQPEAVTPPNVA